MSKIIRCFLTALLLCIAVQSGAQSYDDLWKQVDNYRKKDLPTSVQKSVLAVYEKAQQEKNFSQMTKAFVTLISSRYNISTDSFKVDADKLEAMIPECTNDVDRAVLHVIAGDAYAHVANVSAGRDAEATELYRDLAKKHFAEALADKQKLMDAKTESYEPLLEKGDDSKFYGNDMLSVLTAFIVEKSGMDFKKQIEIYAELAKLYGTRGNRNGQLLMELNKLSARRMLNVGDGAYIDEKEYSSLLKTLAEDFGDAETCADVYAELLRLNCVNKQEKLSLLRDAKERFTDEKCLNYFNGFEKHLLAPKLYVQKYEDVQLAGDSIGVVVVSDNVDDVVIKIKDSNNGRIVYEKLFSLDSRNLKNDSFKLAPLKAGTYSVIAESNGVFDSAKITLNSFSCMFIGYPNDRLCIIPVDARSGKILKGCQVYVSDENSRNKSTAKTVALKQDANGRIFIDLKKYRNWKCTVRRKTGDERTMYCYGYSYNYNDTKPAERVTLFTDRAIYRPGQTVRASLLAYFMDGDSVSVQKNREYFVDFFDANGKVISSKKVVTNEMGSADMDFVIPNSGLTGLYRIGTGNSSKTFRVEEYKRPTFTVDATASSGTISFGDTIDVDCSATTFFGMPVQGAKVKYYVSCRNRDFWLRFYRDFWTVLYDSVAVTDNNGRFSIPVCLDKKMLQQKDGVLEYRVQVEVTDVAGETQKAECIVPVSEKAFGLHVESGKTVLKSALGNSVKILAQDLLMRNINVEGEYSVFEKFGTAKGKKVAEGRFKSGDFLNLAGLKDVASGNYLIECLAYDAKGNKIECQKNIVVFSKDDKRINLSDNWIYVPDNVFGKDKPADVYFASKDKNITLYYGAFSGNKVIDGRCINVSDTVCHFHFNYDEAYGDGLALVFAYMKNGKGFMESVNILREQPNKKLKLTWNTFRDKLKPGSEENWILNVTDSTDSPVKAELLAMLYDASLDELYEHNVDFNVSFGRNVPYVQRSVAQMSVPMFIGLDFKNEPFDDVLRKFTELKECFSNYVFGTRFFKPALMRTKSVMNSAAPMATGSAILNISEMDAVVEQAVVSDAPAVSDEGLRSNLSETAFFYPHLMSDNSGNVHISFKLPDGLTTWRFKGVAHTEDVDYGNISADVVASKDFMVQPNMPRFVRIGDDASIAARIVNKTDGTVEGKALLELIDPETGKVVYSEKKSFKVDAGQTGRVDYGFKPDAEHPLLICQITAGNETFSDGERNYLPVLTDKKWITESVPFFIDGMGEKKVDTGSLFNDGSKTATNKRMTIEYVDNPSWTVVQALHAVAVPDNDNAISLSASYYANKALGAIASRLPKLRTLVEAWRAETEKNGSLSSELEKNSELKTMLLEETPWVIDAQNETEQLRMISDMFDENLMNVRTSDALAKLKRLQRADGSWSWFNGMTGSRLVTENVLKHLAELSAVASLDKDAKDMLEDGFRYIDADELKRYADIKKHSGKDWTPGTSGINYLYLSSLYTHKISAEVDSMQKDYASRLAGISGTLDIGNKAKLAYIMKTFDNMSKASELVASLREYTVYRKDVGRYYDTPKAYYSSVDYRIPVQVDAMKAMAEMRSDFSDTDDYLRDMQLWLVRQKQVQAWDNPINTIEAVNALLMYNGDWTVRESAVPEIKLGKNELKVNNQTAGIGYVKISVPEDVLSKGGNVRIDKKSAGLSWGAVYGQCLEDMESLKKSSGESGLSVERRMLVMRKDSIGANVWRELRDGERLAVGDRVKVRLVVSADRDMDFVQVRDQRAACMEPVSQLSGYRFGNGQGFYVAVHDSSSDYFFDIFRKGTCTIDTEMYVTRSGVYKQGIAEAQCAYSASFVGRSASGTVSVE